MIAQNTAKFSGGSYPTKRYYESTQKPKNVKSAEEIIAEVTKNAGLTVIDE